MQLKPLSRSDRTVILMKTNDKRQGSPWRLSFLGVVGSGGFPLAQSSTSNFAYSAISVFLP